MRIAALLLLGAFAGLCGWSIATMSLTFDEPAYMAAGSAHLHGNFAVNPEHPPLGKALIALPLVVAQRTGLLAAEVDVVNVVPLLRLTSAIAGLATVALCGWWAWRLWGTPMAAVVSLGLASFDPNLVANASVATLDSFLTLFTTLTLYLLWESRRHRASLARAAVAGLAFGCALATKAPAILLLPFVLFLFRPSTWPSRTGWLDAFRESAPRLLTVAVVAAITIYASYGFSSIGPFLQSALWQAGHTDRGHPSFFLGEYSSTGWLLYYPAAMLFKTPLATIAAIVAGTIGAVRFANRDAVAALVVFPCVVVIVTALSYIDIGLRYVMPAYPPLLVAAGVLGSQMRPRRFPALPWLIVAATAASVLRVAPHTLSYFNEAAGGPERGVALLSDSNIDWGQDVKGLVAYQRKHGLATIYFAPFGSVHPAMYGLSAELLPSFPVGASASTALVANDGPQLLAVSITTLQGTYIEGHDLYRWLSAREPAARIGYSILVYDITGDADAHDRLAEVHARTGNSQGADRERAKAAAIRARR